MVAFSYHRYQISEIVWNKAAERQILWTGYMSREPWLLYTPKTLDKYVGIMADHVYVLCNDSDVPRKKDHS